MTDSTSTTTLNFALRYAHQGWRVIPLPANSKVPALKGWPKKATTHTKQIEKWFAKSNSNIGIATGSGSGVLVLDVDVKDGAGGMESLAVLEEKHGKLPETLTVETPSGGRHYYFRDVPGIRNSVSKLAPGLDIRGEGGYVVAPPSVVGGQAYNWDDESVPIADAPQWLIDRLKAAAKATPAGPGDGKIPQGQRNDAVFREASRLRGSNVPEEEALARLIAFNTMQCEPPLDDAEVLRCFESAWRYVPSFKTTELGNKQRLVHHCGHEIRYVRERGKWIVRDGGFWREDSIQPLIEDAHRRIYDEAASEKDEDRRKKLGGWAIASESAARLRATEELARKDPRLQISAAELDANPMLLGVQNGVIDLATGELRAAQPEDYITKVCPVEHDPAAEAPLWTAFLERIFHGDRI